MLNLIHRATQKLYIVILKQKTSARTALRASFSFDIKYSAKYSVAALVRISNNASNKNKVRKIVS